VDPLGGTFLLVALGAIAFYWRGGTLRWLARTAGAIVLLYVAGSILADLLRFAL
jgi:hypothetical protein